MRKEWETTQIWYDGLAQMLNNLEKLGKTVFSVMLTGTIYTIVYYEWKTEEK